MRAYAQCTITKKALKLIPTIDYYTLSNRQCSPGLFFFRNIQSCQEARTKENKS